MDRIAYLAERLDDLIIRDAGRRVFDVADGHHYHLNPRLSEREAAAFEETYQVTLPADYRAFLTRVANGGAGPYYGLMSLQESIAEHGTREFLSTPFPWAQAFNPYKEGLSEDECFDDRFICGSICLSHQGCGYYDRLVITGPQRGFVWTDARVSDGGIVPLDMDFVIWYSAWLERSFADLR